MLLNKLSKVYIVISLKMDDPDPTGPSTASTPKKLKTNQRPKHRQQKFR